MSYRDRQFLRRVVKKVAIAGRKRVRPRIRGGSKGGHGSRQLAAAVQVHVTSDTRSELYIPHYWARFVHDGRGPFGPKRKGYYIFYRNPKEDPRLDNGRAPERASQRLHLTRQEYLNCLKRNADHLRNGGSPFRMPVIITRQIRGRMTPNRFFSNRSGGGMHGFRYTAHRIIDAEFTAHIEKRLAPIMGLVGDISIPI